MHEFALAEAIMRAVARTAADERLTAVTSVKVRVGQLQSIRKELFEFALKETRPTDEPRLAGTDFQVSIVSAAFACRACERRFTLDDVPERDAEAAEAIHFVPELAHAFMRCPSCGSPDFEVVDGRGVDIAEIQGEQEG